MKNLQNSMTLMLFFSGGMMLATGCGVSSTEAGNQALTDVSLAAQVEGDCCSGGSCCMSGAATEDCSGSCAEGTVDGKAAECCGAESANTVTVAAKSEDTCGDCNACANGDSANCKCAGEDHAEVKQQEAASADSNDHPVSSFAEDRNTFHFLLANHEQIQRTVTDLDNGVETVTEAKDPVLAGKLQEHVASMYLRVEDGRPIRMRDPLYRELFKYADKIEMTLENTEHGVRVTETSEDEYVVKLIQAHAKVVSKFAEHGFDEAHKNHEVPK